MSDYMNELSMIKTHEPGIPNRESLSILSRGKVELSDYIIMLGAYNRDTDMTLPFKDEVFWLGNGVIQDGDWVIIHTGGGKATVNPTQDKKNFVYHLYWGKKITIFANQNVVPMLIKLSQISILKPKIDLPQLSALEKLT